MAGGDGVRIHRAAGEACVPQTERHSSTRRALIALQTDVDADEVLARVLPYAFPGVDGTDAKLLGINSYKLGMIPGSPDFNARLESFRKAALVMEPSTVIGIGEYEWT